MCPVFDKGHKFPQAAYGRPVFMGQMAFEVKHLMIADVVGHDKGPGQKFRHELPKLADILSFGSVEENQVPRSREASGKFRSVA